MKDLRTKYKKSGYGWNTKRHWLRRMTRDIKKFLGFEGAAK